MGDLGSFWAKIYFSLKIESTLARRRCSAVFPGCNHWSLFKKKCKTISVQDYSHGILQFFKVWYLLFYVQISSWNSKLVIFMKEAYSVLKTVWKNGLIWLCWPINWFLAFRGQFSPKINPNRPLKIKIGNIYARTKLST